jgi:hypothetical protein
MVVMTTLVVVSDTVDMKTVVVATAQGRKKNFRPSNG